MSARPPLDGATILVTGASSGIGRELARQLASRAGALVLVARRRERLEELADELRARKPGLSVRTESCDLSDPAGVERMLAAVAEKAPAIDVLINDAGLGYSRRYDRADWERIHRLLQVNVVALSLLTLRLSEGMVARRRGGIMNVGSGAGFTLMPGAAAYVGSKYYVNGFTETLRAELAGTGVVVTHVAPGPVTTEFNEAAGITDMRGGPPGFLRITAEECAREAIRGFERGHALVFPGRVYRALMAALWLAPRPVVRRIAIRMARHLAGDGGADPG